MLADRRDREDREERQHRNACALTETVLGAIIPPTTISTTVAIVTISSR